MHSLYMFIINIHRDTHIQPIHNCHWMCRHDMTHSLLVSTLGNFERSKYSGSGALHVSGGDVLYSQISLLRALLSLTSLLVLSLFSSSSWKTYIGCRYKDKTEANHQDWQMIKLKRQEQVKRNSLKAATPWKRPLYQSDFSHLYISPTLFRQPM